MKLNELVLSASIYMSELNPDWLPEMDKLTTFLEGEYYLHFDGRSAYYEATQQVKLFGDVHTIELEHLSAIHLAVTEEMFPGQHLLAAALCFHAPSMNWPYYQIYFQIRLDIFSKSTDSPSGFFMDFLGRIKAIGQIEYGVLNPMVLARHPFTFFSPVSINSSEFTPLERRQANIWKSKCQRYTETVWDIFWGNVLNKGMATPEVIREIAEVVGENNVHDSDGMLVFFVPADFRKWAGDEEESLGPGAALTQILERNNLLMATARVGNKVPARVARYLVARKKPEPYKGPTYVEAHLARGPKDIVKEINDMFSMTASGIARSGNHKFKVLIDKEDRCVAAEDSHGIIVLYDPSKHPSNMAFGQELHPRLELVECEKCGGDNFRIVVGYEYPEDAEGPNDISCFALAGQCVKCRNTGVIFQDETA